MASTRSHFPSWQNFSVLIGRENANDAFLTVPSSTPFLSISRTSSTMWWFDRYLWGCMRLYVIFGWYMKFEYHEIKSWSTGGVFRGFQNWPTDKNFLYHTPYNWTLQFRSCLIHIFLIIWLDAKSMSDPVIRQDIGALHLRSYLIRLFAYCLVRNESHTIE